MDTKTTRLVSRLATALFAGGKNKWPRVAGIVVLLAIAAFSATRYGSPDLLPAGSGADTIVEAYNTRTSSVWVEAGGQVEKLLSDDNEGSRHQRFILSVAPGHTVLVAHNIDLAQRIPASEGDRITFRGEYEYNDRGGVIHWTHHDPQGRHAGGWIEHAGTRYK